MNRHRSTKRGLVLKRYMRMKLAPLVDKTNKRMHNAPLMTILFATSTSLLMYQNCSPAMESTESASSKTAVYSSTIGGPNGGLPSGVAGGGGSYAPGTNPTGGGSTVGGVMPVGGGGTGGGTGGTGGGTGGTGGGGTGGTGGGGTIPVDGGSGGTGMVGGGNTGVSPGGSTGGTSAPSFIWQYQPEDRTVEEGEVLTLGTYATKGIDLVTYQWFKNGQAINGQTGYMLRQFQVTTSSAGQYHVEARSGADMIRSVTVTVKVKAARNPCPAGKYGYYPGTRNYDEYWHESMIGASNAPHTIQRELPDAYTLRLPYSNPSVVGFGQCVAASGLFQCRNGKMISIDDIRCDQYYESPGGI
jgi:hypothetical protein